MQKTRRWVARFLVAGSAVWLAAGQQGCSLLNTTAVQCLSEAECLSKGAAFAGTTCDPVTKTCVAVDAGVGDCNTNADCITANASAPSICRKSDKKCAVLQTAECPFVLDTKNALGGPNSENVIVLGAFTPANDSQLGLEMERTIELAQSDFVSSAAGLPALPGQSGTRPVVFAMCNEFGAGFAGLIRAANHLTKDLQVPIIVGPVDQGNLLQVLTQVALPSGTMIFGPTSTLSSLSGLGPNPAAPTPLIWRTSFADSSFSSTAADLITADTQNRITLLTGEKLRILEVVEGDIFGALIGTQIQQKLCYNKDSGGACIPAANQTTSPCTPANGCAFYNANMGNPRDPVGDPAPAALIGKAVIPEAFQLRPHIIATGATLVAIPNVLTPLEAQWDAATGAANTADGITTGLPLNASPRPIWVAANPSWQSDLLGAAIQADTSIAHGQIPLIHRVFVIRGQVPADNGLQAAFISNFNGAPFNTDLTPQLTAATINPLLFNVYDAAYLAEFALAALGSQPLTGVNTANAMASKLASGGTEVTDDPGTIGTTFGTLASGGSVTLNGLAGDMAFDPATGAPPGNGQVACVGKQGSALTFPPSGFIWDHTTNQGTGTVSPVICPAN